MNNRQNRLWWALWPAGVVVGAAAEWVSISHDVPENHWLDLAVGWAYIAAGLIAWRRRSDSRLGVLMTVVGFTWFIGNFEASAVPVVFSLAFAFETLNEAVLAHMVLSYPEGRLHDGVERGVVVALYSWMLVDGLAIMLTYDPALHYGCAGCPSAGLAAFQSNSAFEAIDTVGNVVGGIFAALVLALIIRRLVSASPTARKILSPMWAAGLLTALVFVSQAVSESSSLQVMQRVVMLGIPCVFLYGLFRTQAAQGSVGSFVRALAQPLPRGRLREKMAVALGDPTLEVAFAREAGGYVDEEGRDVELPPSGSGRETTHISSEGEPVAVLIHDPCLLEQGALVETVAAAARLALENERLQAEILAQLEEVRESRARIVEAGDDERFRMERDIHDGAQQRLVTLAMALAMAEERAECTEDPELSAMLAEATKEVGKAVEELRNLAQGIHPTILTEAGLGPALESLALRSSIPTKLTAQPSERFAPQIELAAYFVAAEALTNAMKHSRARSVELSAGRVNGGVVVRVADDGVGGADPARGSGLGGLRDRLAALDGTLTIEEPSGGGTHIVAEIPCE